MSELFNITLANYKAILAPFLMMTSCATLVWALQSRFSRIVQAIRTLVSEGKRDNIDYTHSLAKQVKWLKGRSLLLRNSITSIYFAMCCFLLTAMLLAIAIISELQLSLAIVTLFLLGLILVCAALISALVETSRSFDSLEEEISRR